MILKVQDKIRSQLRRLSPDYLILLALVVLVFVLNTIWIRTDTLTPHWDMARHLEVSNIYLSLINKSIAGNFEAFKDIFGSYQYYPPFFYYLTAFWYKIFGNSQDVAASLNIVPLTILVFSVFGIGKKLWDRRTGLLSAVIVVSIPIFISQMKEYQLDFPTAAFVGLAFYLLLISENFRNLRYSIFFGIVCGIGMLTKWPFLLFIAGPLAVVLIKLTLDKVASYRKKKKVNFSEFKNLIVAFLFFFLIAGPWYIHNLEALKRDFFGNIDIANIEGDPPVLTWQSFQYYFWAMLNGQLYLVLFLPFGIGLFHSIFNKEALKKNLLLLSMLLVAYIGFSLFKNKDIRFTAPLLPGAAILISYWVFLIKQKLLRYSLVAYCLIISFICSLAINFGAEFLPRELSFTINDQQQVVVFAQHGYIIGQPVKEDWQVEKIVALINQDRIRHFENQEIIGIHLLIDDEMRFNYWDFRYYSVLHSFPFVISSPDYPPNYYIISSRERLDSFKDQADQYAEDQDQQLSLLYESTLPNQNKLYVYRVK